MFSQKQNALLGAMIGLVRAADKNGKSGDSDALLLLGVRVLRDGGDLDAVTQRVREEKAKIAPGCALCATPCGSTADADMGVVWQGNAQAAALKKEILQQVFVLAEMLESGARTEEQTWYHLHKGLFFIGEYAAPAELTAVLAEMKA